MDRVLACLTIEHDLRLVALAGVLCFFSSLLAMVLMQRARSGKSQARKIWLGTAGSVAGFGIWATHFVAMLAFEPVISPVYTQGLTFASLIIAIAATTGAIACATYLTGRGTFIAVGILFGAGVSCMHFTGMAAMEFAGTILWDITLVVTAIIMSMLLAIPAFYVVLGERSGNRHIAASATLLTLAIVAMHFTAMGAAGILQ